MTKALFILLFAVILMDPCDKKPRPIGIDDVGEACKTETGRMYVRLTGKLKDTGEIACSDQPGGFRCELLLASEDGRHEVWTSFRGAVASAGSAQFHSVVVAPEGTPRQGLEPYSVPFERAEIYNRDGIRIEHAEQIVSLAGPLRPDNNDGGSCTMHVLHVEK